MSGCVVTMSLFCSVWRQARQDTDQLLQYLRGKLNDWLIQNFEFAIRLALSKIAASIVFFNHKVAKRLLEKFYENRFSSLVVRSNLEAKVKICSIPTAFLGPAVFLPDVQAWAYLSRSGG